MHFHHKHDIAGCTDHHGDWPDWATTILATLDRQGYMIMSANQDQLDAIAGQLATLAADFAAAKDAAPAEEPLDFTGVQAAVAQLQALAPAAPVDDPGTGVVAEPVEAPTDGTVTDVPAPDQPAPDAPQVPSVPLA